MSDSMKQMLAAAEKGDATSQFNLGVVYDNLQDDRGHEMGGKLAEAIKWLRRAAEQGLPHAQIRLAEIYANGPDAPRDHVKASTWFLLAAANSAGAYGQRARAGYTRIFSQMSPEEIAKARRLALTWKPKQRDIAAAVNHMERSKERAP